MTITPSNTTQWMRAAWHAGPTPYLAVFGAGLLGGLIGGAGRLPPEALSTTTLLTIAFACLLQFYAKPTIQKRTLPPLGETSATNPLSRTGLLLLGGQGLLVLLTTAALALARGGTELPIGYIVYAIIAIQFGLVWTLTAKIKRTAEAIRQEMAEANE